MKIIITCHSYYPRKDGVQFVTQYLAEGLAKKGNEVVVYTNFHSEDTDKKEELYNGVLIKRIDAQTKHTIHYGNKKKYINSIINESKDSDLMINVCVQCATTDWLLSKLDQIKIPKILYNHSIWNFKINRFDLSSFKSFFSKIWSNIRWGIYYSVNGKNFKKYDIVTQLHDMDISTLFFKKRYGIDSKIIENAAEQAFFENENNKDIDLPDKYIINVSNYLKGKNQEETLRIFLNSKIADNWELILIGSHKNNYYYKLVDIYDNYLKNGGKKKVSILSDINRNDIPTYVKGAKIYLMNSKKEGFPISLVESVASGVPFISSDVGIVKFIPGGVVCKNKDEYNYWLDKFTNDEQERKLYGNLGKTEAIRKYTIEGKINQLEDLINECINKYKINK